MEVVTLTKTNLLLKGQLCATVSAVRMELDLGIFLSAVPRFCYCGFDA